MGAEEAGIENSGWREFVPNAQWMKLRNGVRVIVLNMHDGFSITAHRNLGEGENATGWELRLDPPAMYRFRTMREAMDAGERALRFLGQVQLPKKDDAAR